MLLDEQTKKARLFHEHQTGTRMRQRTCPACGRGGGLVYAPGDDGRRYRCRYCGVRAAMLAEVRAVDPVPRAAGYAGPTAYSAAPRRGGLRRDALPLRTLYDYSTIGNLAVITCDGKLAGVALIVATHSGWSRLVSFCAGHPRRAR